MLEKLAIAIQVSLEIPEEEVEVAKKASQSFVELLSNLSIFSKHLNYALTSFEGVKADPELILSKRRMFREYRDRVIENFEKVLSNGYQAMSLLGEFSSDSVIEEIIGAISSKLEEIEDYLTNLISIFGNMSSPKFIELLVGGIKNIKQSVAQAEQIITDRALQYLDKNILGRTLTSFKSRTDKLRELERLIDQKTPEIVELYRERQSAAMGKLEGDDNVN
jgi:hypothetical protein